MTPPRPSGQGHRITWDEEACVALGPRHSRCCGAAFALREATELSTLSCAPLCDCTMTGAWAGGEEVPGFSGRCSRPARGQAARWPLQSLTVPFLSHQLSGTSGGRQGSLLACSLFLKTPLCRNGQHITVPWKKKIFNPRNLKMTLFNSDIC